MTADMLHAHKRGDVTFEVAERYPLSEAVKVHSALEIAPNDRVARPDSLSFSVPRGGFQQCF